MDKLVKVDKKEIWVGPIIEVPILLLEKLLQPNNAYVNFKYLTPN
jgi:hypothetical protein